MSSVDRKQQFALEVLKTLRAAGYTAYWAGGCVRDRLLSRTPKDYDVATNATPGEIRRLFGSRRTLEIGAAFGVVAVVGPKGVGNVEVTTFRRDAAYSDGRHPDQVTFSDPQEDAQRRDFTINGLFYDPLADEVIDFVGGRDDLARRVIRAIGDPHARFAEDKLRMLRAVRFSATYAFALDPATEAAIRQMAGEILVVSPERIAAEMRLMLVHPTRATACRLLQETGLLAAVLPEVIPLAGIHADTPLRPGADLWEHTLSVLDRLREPGFPLALAALVHNIGKPATIHQQRGKLTFHNHEAVAEEMAEHICRRWRLSNDETQRVAWLVRHHAALRAARRMPWSQLQRILIAEGIADLVALHEADALVSTGDLAEVEYCRQKLQLAPGELNPPPLITGDDLIQHGVPRGKIYKTLLDRVRDAQLEKRIASKEEALRMVDQIVRQ
jgi:poly(A) polymerase